MSPILIISYFFLAVGRGNSKPPIVIVENFQMDRVDIMNLRLFLREVCRMLITINMKSDIAFVAINNSPYGIQKRSTNNNRHTIVLGNIKNYKVR